MSETTAQIYSLTKEKLFSLFQTSDKGLSTKKAQELLQEYGPNKLTAKKRESALSMYLGQFKNTLTIILIVSAFLILFIYYFGEKDPSDLIEAGLILGIVFMITVLGFAQEFKAEKAIESLKRLLAYKAKVRRDGREFEIEVSELVPGDIVILEEGTKVPADIRLFEVFSLRVNEASLTGESAPVAKITGEISGNIQLADQKNMVFAGTNIVSGRAIGMVVATGDKTEIGKIAKDVASAEEEQTPIQIRLEQIGKVIGYLILGICAVVFVFIFFFAKDFRSLPFLQKIIQSFIASVALAVAAIPEGLPAVVTVSLALGTQRMLRRNALVRKLNSVETLGSTDVICSDKTGTFTKGEMTIRKIYSNEKLIDVTGTGYESTGDFTLNGKKIETKDFSLLLEAGYLCNNASLDEGPSAGSGGPKVLGDPTEAALLVSAKKAKITPTGERISEIPFSSERKMMTVVIKRESKYFVFSKGAPEILLEHCNISVPEKKKILDINKDLSNQALRNLGFAYKEITKEEFEDQSKYLSSEPKSNVIPAKTGIQNKVDPRSGSGMTGLEDGLIFLGLQAMIDPPRVEVKPLIEECRKSGIRTVMITGDNGETAKAVAREVGITGDVLTGVDLEEISDEEFSKVVERVSIYARVNPSVKMRIVNALKKKGHIVAMTGDGVNDAPALKASDIGIAMGITGTDVAKEASDMVLLDDKFSSIVSAIEEGRGIFHNIRKFVMYLLSCNIAEVLIVFIGVIVLQELVLTATMLLWINVVTDGIPAIALGMDEAEKGIMNHSPKVFQSEIVSKRLWFEMLIFGVLLTVGVIGIYLIDLPSGVDNAQGAAFTAIVIFELVNIYLIRSNYKTAFFSNIWLLISIAVTIVLQVIIVYVPFLANLFGVRKIDFLDWIYIVAVSGLLCLGFKFAQSMMDKLAFFRTDTAS